MQINNICDIKLKDFVECYELFVSHKEVEWYALNHYPNRHTSNLLVIIQKILVCTFNKTW